MFEFLNSKYRNSTELVRFQDYLISLPSINTEKVDEYISELNKYNILFNSFLGLNSIPESNIAIRQNLVLAALYYIKKDLNKAKELKEKADNLFVNLKASWFYLEGFSYWRYVKSAYDFYFKFCPQHFAGNIDSMTLLTMGEFYKKISNYDGSLPVTDTYFSDRVVPEQERLNFSNNLYSTYYLNSQSTYVFINHNSHISWPRNNRHINFEFGHFVVFDKGRWKVLHPWYPGYASKSNSKIKESWNNNIIVGSHSSEPLWRLNPNPPGLYHDKRGPLHNFRIGRNGEFGKRTVEIMNNGIVVTDNGGDYSSFNISDDCDFNVTGKIKESVGYHSPEVGKVEIHKRIELYGSKRVFSISF